MTYQKSFLLPFILISAIMVTGCTNSGQERLEIERKSYISTIQLVKKDSLAIEIDSITGLDYSKLRVFSSEGKQYISLFSTPTQMLYIYEYGTRTPIKSMKFEKEGPNGVGTLNSVNCEAIVYSLDEIFVSNYFETRIYRLNGKAEVLKRYQIGSKDTGIKAIPEISEMPVLKVGNDRLIFAFEPSKRNNYDYSKTPSIGILDLNTGDIRNGPLWPKEYNGAAYLGKFRYAPHILQEMGTDKLLLSYPMSPYIYRTDLAFGKMEQYYASSPNFKNTAPYMSYDEYKSFVENNKQVSYEAQIEFSATVPHYATLYNLEAHDLLVRGLYQGVTQTEFDTYGTDYPYRFSLVIYDRGFNYKGETQFSAKDYWSIFSFDNGNGIHLLRKAQKSEGELVFDIFVPQPIEG